MKKKNYVKPIACCIVSYSNTHLLAGSPEESLEPVPFEPTAKKNTLSSEETDSEDQYQSNSVAGSTKNLWND